MPEHVRAYIYRVLTAVGAVLTFHGVITDTALTVYLSAAATVLGVGLAAANTSTKR